MRLNTARIPLKASSRIIAAGTALFLLLGFVLDLATAQELVVAIIYNVPIAISGLSSQRRLLRYTTAAALLLNVSAGVINGLGGVDTVSILNRVIASLSYLLVFFMTSSLRASSMRLAALQASEARATREHLLHAFLRDLGHALTPDALLEDATRVLRRQLRAEAVVISACEGNRFSGPQYADPPPAALRYARSGSPLPWLAALARTQESPVASGQEEGHDLLVGLLGEPRALVCVVVGSGREDAAVYAGDALRELGNLLERTELLEHLERQRAELARRNGTFRDLVYAFSHDLRTPLIANAMNMRLALEGAYGVFGEEYRRVLQNGLSANEDLLELADALLLVARLESGEALSVPGAVDFVALLHETLARLEPVIAAQAVQVDLDAPSELRLLGNAAELRRVCQNLLDNAVKFSPPGGRVRVQVQRDDTDLSAQGVTLSVCDEGPGVAETVLPHLFERFSHGRAGGGSGLGLYLAQKIVVGHGGTVHYAPGEHGGSCFSLWLPIAPEAVTA